MTEPTRDQLLELAKEIADALESPSSASAVAAVSAYIRMGKLLSEPFCEVLGNSFAVGMDKPPVAEKDVTRSDLRGEDGDKARVYNQRLLSRLFDIMRPIAGAAFADRDNGELVHRDLAEWGKPRALPLPKQKGAGHKARRLDKIEAQRRVYELVTYEAGRTGKSVKETQRTIFIGDFDDNYWRDKIAKPFLQMRNNDYPGCGEDEEFWIARGRGQKQPHPDLKQVSDLALLAKA